jgi:hypothetical protein
MANQGAQSFIKDPYVKTVFATKKQLEEFKACCDPVTGYLYFMSNFFHIQHPTKGSMLYQPWEFQKRLINTYHNYRYSISLMPRQSGKSTSAAGYLLWYAMFVPDSTILIAAHKYTGAQEIMQRIRYAYEHCPMHIKAGVTTYNKGSLDFENGSRIVSATTTENTGRGMSISLLYCLDGDTTAVKIRNKNTLLEEDITLKNLYTRLYNPEKVLDDEFGFVDEKDK